MIFEDSIEGILREHKATTTLLGAENREKVTCYLDALLFAMFAKLDSFEAILFDHFEDGSRRRLAGLLRLWVNMLRSGMLITTDIVGKVAPLNSTYANLSIDSAYTEYSCSMWMGRSEASTATRRVRGIHIHH